jgi:hypothetical protein
MKKAIFTLLIISPIVLFAFENFYPKPKVSPPQALIGNWETLASTELGEMRVCFNLSEDGAVEGTVGGATMRDAQFRKNRRWIGRMLGLGTDYIIAGDLKGSVIEGVQCEKFWIVGQFGKSGIRADIDCAECWQGNKKHFRFGAGPLTYNQRRQR